MASLRSRWEALLTIPTGDWAASLTESGGGGAQTITLTAANEYYWSSAGNDSADLPARLAALLDTASVAAGNSNTYTVTVDATEGGTGKLTISVDAGTFSLTSIDDDLEALMGLSGEMTPSASSFTGANQVEGLWLPDTTVETPYGLASSGLVVSETVTTLAADGTYNRFSGAKHVRNEYVYQYVAIARTVQASEATANESYESFWLDAIRGEEPWAKGGRELRYYKDVSDDATSKTYNYVGGGSPDIARTDTSYDGFWTVRIEVVED